MGSVEKTGAMPQTLREKVFTVSGGSRGTGLAVARQLLMRGASVAVSASSTTNLDRAKMELEKAVEGCADRLMVSVCDITKLDQVATWVRAVVERFGHLDGCANVAGVPQQKLFSISDLPLEDWHTIIDTNLTGTFYLLREQLKAVSDGGSIVNVGSVASKNGNAGQSAYTASKHGLVGLTKAAAFEASARGIRVNSVCPGGIKTDMTALPFLRPDGTEYITRGDTVPQLFRRLAEPDEIASTIVFLLGDDSKFVTKAEWYVDGGFCEGSFLGV